MHGHFRAGTGTQITIAAFNRSIAIRFLLDTGLKPRRVADITVARETATIVQPGIAQIGIRPVGFLDVVVGLPPDQADEIVAGPGKAGAQGCGSG